MSYGLKEIELAKLNEVFAANERIERVVLYGSRAKGNYKPFSDVDITLEGAELTHTDLNRISLAIDDLLLPYQFDISIFHTLKNEALIDHIRRMGITIYEKKCEWKEYKLGEIASFVAEKVSVQDVRLEDYISTENMLPDKGGITIASNKPQEGSATKYFCYTILISNIRPYFKKIWYANKSGGCSNDVLCFKAKDELVFSKYLYFLLSQDTFFDYVMLGSKGCKMPRGDKSHILNWEISIPPLPTQRRIAAILSSLDDKIDLLHRENATLEQMAETLFRQWFVAEAKEEWEERPLGKCIKLVGGGTPKTSEERFWNGNVCWLSGGDIANNHKNYVSSSEKSISEDGLNNSSAKLLPENAMVVSARGTVGKYCLLSKPMAFSQSNYGILPIYSSCYFFTYLLVAYHIDELQSAAYGSVFDTITTKTFEGVSVLLPKETGYIVEFEKMIEPYFSKMKYNNKQIQTLIQTRDGLLPRLMGGEVKL